LGFDIAVKNGLVIDGTGNPGFKANLYINNGKIVEISRTSLPISADTVIDANGLIVAPGFIDIHQHSDFTIFACPRCESYIHQGVTTVAGGNCGLSSAPLSDKYREEMKRYYEPFTLGLEIPYNWRTFGEYLARIEELKPGVNFWPQIGHCTIRASVMGYEARRAEEKEIEEMKSLLEESLKEGAQALSSGDYAPAYWADTSELIELAKVVAEYSGIYTTHLRREGFEEAVEIGEKAGIPVEVAHYDGKGVAEARRRGIDVTYDAYPYHAGSSFLGQILPFWLYEGGKDGMLEKIKEEKVRRRVKRELRNFDWKTAVVSFVPERNSKKYEGRSIENIVKSENVDPVDFLCDLLLDNDGNGLWICMNGRTEAYVFKTLIDPYHYVISDGWGLATYEPLRRGKIHPRCYGTFPRVLGWYVRECDAISLQEAIRKMTSGPALKMGIRDRGLLREGFWADITIFDPKTIIDKATFEDPHQYPVGIEYVIVNGKVVIEEGEHTGVQAGKVLRRTSHKIPI